MIGVKTFFSLEGINTQYIVNLKRKIFKQNNLFDKSFHLVVLKYRHCTGKLLRFSSHHKFYFR